MGIKAFFAKISGKQSIPLTDEIATVGVLDRFSTYPSKGLTPERLASILREADSGDVARQSELFEEMLEKDAHLQALFQVRKLSVSRRNYTIIPASGEKRDVDLANEVDEMIKNIAGWKNTINDILDCVPKGFSVNEIFWEPQGGKYVIREIKWRHQKRFRFGKASDFYSDPDELRLILDQQQAEQLRGIVPAGELSHAMTDGISLTNTPQLRRRFVIAYCRARSGHPARASLLRTCTFLFLFKNYDIKWWVQFAEKLLGYRIGKYDPSQPEQKEILEKAVRALGFDAAAVITKDSEIIFTEMAGKAASHQIYSEFLKWCNDEMTKCVLGHTGSVQSVPGELGGKDIAKEVVQELIESDASVLDEVITDDIIRPYIEFNYGPQERYPYYHTEIEEEEDIRATAEIVEKYQRIGGRVSEKWAREKFGIPAPDPMDKEDRALEPASTLPLLAAAQISDEKKKLLTKR